MEAKLRAGDSTLLSVVLGARLALLAYKQWEHDQQSDQGI